MKTFKQFINDNKKKLKQRKKTRDREHHFHWYMDDLEHHKNNREHHFHWYMDDLEHHKNNHEKLDEAFGGTYAKPIKSKKGFDQFNDAHEDLKSQHYNIISSYKEGNDVNRRLRRAGKEGPEQLKQKVKEINHDDDYTYGASKNAIKHLDHVTNYKLKAPLSVYRGVHKKSTDPKNLKIGDTFTDHGYTSTSLEHTTASDPDFAYHGKTPNSKNKTIPHIFHIHLAKGDHGRYIDHPKISDRLDTDLEHEKEVLLPRGTTYKVLGHEHVEDSDGARHVIHIKPLRYRKD
jgi:hypothetical protein